MAAKPAIEPERPLSYGALLLFGALTLWIYTAFRFCRRLRDHAAMRARELAADTPSVPNDPLRHALRYARLHAVPAALVLPVFVVLEIVFEMTGSLGVVPWVVALLSATFAGSVVTLLVGLFRGLRQHEALELRRLTVQGVSVEPDVLERRSAEWNAQESWLTLTAIVSVACIASPAVAVVKLAQLPTLVDARGLMLSDRWATAVVCFGGLFNALGTAFLVRLVNGHFAWERRLGHAAAQGAASPRGIALKAVLFTDICGYSRLMEKDEAAALRLLERHNTVVREAIRKHGGHEIKTIGDAFLVVFDSAVQAVECAVALQRALHAHNRTAEPAGRVLVRAGVHVGDVLVTDGDVLGDSVNLAARLESVAEPGGVCVSDQVRQVVSRRLSLPFVPLGPVPLKNLASSPELFSIPRAYLEAEEPATP